MCEMLVMAGILYCTSFDNYLGSVNPGRLTIFDVIMFMSAVVVAASYDQNDSSLDLVQILISLVIGVFFISMIVSCRKKYYDDIVRCMADYEFAESKKDKKNCVEVCMKIVISTTVSMPIYEQIINQIRDAVVSGELKAGDGMPSIRVLAKELAVSVITTKRAYEELEKEGVIESVPGRGFYVCEQKNDLLREKQMMNLENRMSELLADCENAGMTLKDIIDMVRVLGEKIMDETIIKIENAALKLKKFMIKPANLEIPKGYIVGVQGENGAGKTTLLHMMLGMYDKMKGKIYIDGLDVVKK